MRTQPTQNDGVNMQRQDRPSSQKGRPESQNRQQQPRQEQPRQEQQRSQQPQEKNNTNEPGRRLEQERGGNRYD